MLLFFLLLFFMDAGVSAETKTVMEGDSVTLHTNLSDIRNDDTILWLFGPKDSVISQITRQRDLNSIYFTDDVRFRGRLQMDQNTGSLTIRNTRIKHSGQYKLSISREKTTIKIFSVTVSGAVNETDEVESESVMEGDSVTLNTDTDIHPYDLILWRFGDKGILLAKIDVETNEISLNEADERFRDRLKIDNQTGSLTITNTRTEHTGLYELQIRGSESSQRFLLSVTAVADAGLSPGGIAGITVAVLLVLVVVVIYYSCTISKLKQQVAENKKVEEGEALRLATGVPKLHKDDKVQWYYKGEDEDILIAENNKVTNETPSDGVDGRFRSKLLDDTTGDLTITDIKTLHSGLYILKISSKIRTKHNRFIVIVTAKNKSVAKVENVPLDTGVENIQTVDLILWTFGAKNCFIAKADSRTTDINERFRHNLKLDPQTGSLTITNTRDTEYGHYKLQIINQGQTTFRRFIVLEPAKPKSVAERENVLLESGVKNIQPDDLILWMFGPENCLVAKADSETVYITERFKDNLKLDKKTGSLTIKNIKNTEYGHYKLQIINKDQTTFRRFNVLESDDQGQQSNENTALLKREKKHDVLVLQNISY